jgi:hypothetical protein
MIVCFTLDANLLASLVPLAVQKPLRVNVLVGDTVVDTAFDDWNTIVLEVKDIIIQAGETESILVGLRTSGWEGETLLVAVEVVTVSTVETDSLAGVVPLAEDDAFLVNVRVLEAVVFTSD